MMDILEKGTGRLEGSTIIVDRGIALDENLAAIRGRECHYIADQGRIGLQGNEEPAF